MAGYNLDPFGKMQETERWISQDKLNRQQLARQNALQDIQQQSAQLGLEQKQGDAAFRNMLATNPQQARTDFKLRYDQAYPGQKAGGWTNIKEGRGADGQPGMFGIRQGGSQFEAIPGMLPQKPTEDKSKLAGVTQKQVNVLRADIGKVRKTFNDVENAHNRISSIGKNGTPASDLALIFNFMKMLDPGSVVRESEFKTAEAAKAWLVRSEDGGTVVPAPIANAIRRADLGTLLDPNQRIDFLSQAKDLYGAQRGSTDDQITRILAQGEEDKIDGKRILGKTYHDALKSRISRRDTKNKSDNEFPEGATATHPDGRTIVYRNGQWEAM